jgi:Glucodextranase, domain B
MALHSGIERARLLSVLALAAGIAAGCGSSSSSAPPGISLSLTAPSYHATVGVPTIDVLGSVDPGTAIVRVNRARARVAQGAFNSPVTLHRGLNRIRIVATADGFKQATVSLKLRYHPRAGANPLPAVHHRFKSFTARANHDCAVADGALELLPAPTTETTKVQYLARLVPIQARLDAQLAAITPPRATAAAYADLIHALQRGLDADSRELDDIQAGDLSNMTVQLRRFERSEQKVGRQARALGLRECS